MMFPPETDILFAVSETFAANAQLRAISKEVEDISSLAMATEFISAAAWSMPVRMFFVMPSNFCAE